MKKKNQTQSGILKAQAAIEFALVLPILLVLVLGVLDLGRLFYTKMVLTNAAREGANFLAYSPEDSNYSYVDTFAAIYDEANSSNIEVLSTEVVYTDCCTKGLPVEVTITKTIDLVFDDALQTLGITDGPIQVTSSVKMRVQ